MIAYKQPVTRQDIENIRQVNSDSVVLTLLNKNLICEVGRRETLGRPLLYGTTEQFLSFFGINSLADLPPLEQFAANENAQTEEKLILPI
ncbi:Segregation and condensation protein B [bioreactor metagenome]|uniref:Segregation and condensation protein B n=1 Tax=bioreactor metagenome TaxID=1076179 RepID=A0A645EJE0_9ZZZZ